MTDNGSPLKIITDSQAQKLQTYFHEKHNNCEVQVAYGMSYSPPFISDAIHELVVHQNCQRIIVLPLYPQYSATQLRRPLIMSPKIFHDENSFLNSFLFLIMPIIQLYQACVEQIQKAWNTKKDGIYYFPFTVFPTNMLMQAILTNAFACSQ